MTNHVPLRVPEHFSRVDIGAYMRELRLHYGLSEQDVSERLHIRAKYVVAIESAQFDLMPGKAYARGYVHTYAEFLGLDADHTVERCFGGEMAREVQAHSIPDSASWYKRNRRYGGVVAVLLLLGGLFYIATHDNTVDDDQTLLTDDAATVEAVPEEYLDSMRNKLMPTAGNFECLGRDGSLGCYFAQRITQRWITPRALPDMAPAPGDSEYERSHEDDEAALDAEKAPVKEKNAAIEKAPAKQKAQEKEKPSDNTKAVAKEKPPETEKAAAKESPRP